MARGLVRILLLLALFLCIGATQMEATAALLKDRDAVKAVVAFVSDDVRGEFLRRAEDFGTDRAFTLKTSPTRPDGKHFVVQMWREDIEIILINPFNDPTEFRIYFYLNKSGAAVTAIDSLATDLKETLRSIAGVTLRELG